MAVETVEYMMSCYGNTSFASKLEATAIREAASGLEIVEKLMKNLSNSQGLNHEIQSMEAVADAAVSKFKRCISLLDRSRTGHARFRRAPVLISNQNQNLEVDQGNPVTEPMQSIPPLPLYHPQTLNPVLIPEDENSNTQIVYCPVPVQQIPPLSLPLHYQQRHNMNPLGIVMERSNSINFSNSSSATNSFMSSLTGDTNTSSRHNPSCSQMKEISHGTSIGKPPLPSLPAKRKSNSSENPDSPCHCPKKSKKNNKQRRTIRVPAISMKVADIPPDNYSWRKYGQKPIKGSSHPRGYYKCSSAKSCPARKHVERASDDSSMLIVTYEFEHNHDLSVGDASGMILESS